MSKFEDKVNAVSKQDINEFLGVRWYLMTQHTGNICTQSTDTDTDTYAPFDYRHYPYGDRVQLNMEPWDNIRRQAPLTLIDPNPFARSLFRDGYKCWDSAIGIPNPKSRVRNILPMFRTPVLRDINDYWTTNIVPALKRVGPIGPNRSLKRPEDTWIFDLTKMDDGWKILEAAHVLAHIQGDNKSEVRKWSKKQSKLYPHLQEQVAHIMFALAYDLPLDVSNKEHGRPAEPDFPYGIEVKTSSRYDLPYLRAPWDNPEALRLDETLVVVTMGVFAEPPPYGFIAGTGIHKPHDRWCCVPSLVVMAGWETTEVVTHQPLVRAHVDKVEDPICYGMHPRDMMPPASLWRYLRLGMDARGLPRCDDPRDPNARYLKFHDFINSEVYRRALAETPPLPCAQCMYMDWDIDGIPGRPEGLPPKKLDPENKKHQLWIQYYARQKQIHAIVEKSVVRFERQFADDRMEYKRERRRRKKGHKDKMLRVLKDLRVEESVEKLKQGKRLKACEQRACDERKAEQEDRR